MRDFWIKYVADVHLFQNEPITLRYITIMITLHIALISDKLSSLLCWNRPDRVAQLSEHWVRIFNGRIGSFSPWSDRFTPRVITQTFSFEYITLKHNTSHDTVCQYS